MKTISLCPNHHPLELVRYYNVQLWSWYRPSCCPCYLRLDPPRRGAMSLSEGQFGHLASVVLIQALNLPPIHRGL